MLHIQESYVNATEGYRLADLGVYETYFEDDEVGKLFRSCQKEYGRCVSKVYVDSKIGDPMHVGWVFRKKVKYEDVDEYFTQEVWITLHDKPDTVTTTHHYHVIG